MMQPNARRSANASTVTARAPRMLAMLLTSSSSFEIFVYLKFAVAMIFVFPIGIPVVYLALLLRAPRHQPGRRDVLQFDATAKHKTDSTLAPLYFCSHTASRATGALRWRSGTALVEVELLMLELQLRDIEVRLTMAELDADLEALNAKHGELADECLACARPTDLPTSRLWPAQSSQSRVALRLFPLALHRHAGRHYPRARLGRPRAPGRARRAARARAARARDARGRGAHAAPRAPDRTR
jgi:hypothetical protein